MSEHLDIEAIKARLAAATPGPWELVDFPVMFPRVQSIAEDKSNICETWGWADAKFIAAAPDNIAALLAEVERLQRERAEWRDRADALMTEQMTQMRDLTAEVEALREALTLTPERVEAAALALWHRRKLGDFTILPDWTQKMYRDDGRAALLAAGMTDAALDAAEGEER